MEQLLLGFLFVRQELYVIHDEHVIFPVFIFELVDFLGLYRGDKVGGESFRGDIEDFFLLKGAFYMVSYRLDEMCFPMSRSSVHKKRVVHEARFLCTEERDMGKH